MPEGMTLEEFEEKMHEIRENFRSCQNFNYTCNIVNCYMGFTAKLEYMRLLSTISEMGVDSCYVAYFESAQRAGMDVRPLALEMFYQTCLSFELYKEF